MDAYYKYLDGVTFHKVITTHFNNEIFIYHLFAIVKINLNYFLKEIFELYKKKYVGIICK